MACGCRGSNESRTRRRQALRRAEELFAGARAGIVYVTAFRSHAAMARYLAEIAWATEVWIAEVPSHLIHFDGDRFSWPVRNSVMQVPEIIGGRAANSSAGQRVEPVDRLNNGIVSPRPPATVCDLWLTQNPGNYRLPWTCTVEYPWRLVTWICWENSSRVPEYG